MNRRQSVHYLNFCKNYSLIATTFLALFLVSCSDPESGSSDNATAVESAPGPESRATVSGISAGGYMAVQTHIALAGRIDGAAVLAGGPYHCAEGKIKQALGPCINGEGLDAASLVTSAREAESTGEIGPLGALSDSRVWIFRGQQDAVVATGVALALQDFYLSFIPAGQVAFIDHVPAAHGWPTLDKGEECGVLAGDYFNACDYDAAGELLQHLYGPLNPPATALDSGLRTFDQKSLVVDGGNFADEGLVYVPQACSEPENSCRLHVAFHGCRQGQEFIGDHFAKLTGLNEWAESNDIVVLYPQVIKSMFNPQGCWDWWGYTGDDYDRKSGKQISTIAAFINAWSN
jgi:poly(3-hydroxybutyrate) depolymerase